MASLLSASPCSLLPVLHLPWRPAGEQVGAVRVCGQHAAAGGSLGGHLRRAELKGHKESGGRQRRLLFISHDEAIQSQIFKTKSITVIDMTVSHEGKGFNLSLRNG